MSTSMTESFEMGVRRGGGRVERACVHWGMFGTYAACQHHDALQDTSAYFPAPKDPAT